MSKRKKWYVVWSGNETGLFDNWADCEDQVKGVPGARYKAYNTVEAYRNGEDNGALLRAIARGRSNATPVNYETIPEIVPGSIAVDGACSGNPGIMEYRGVDVMTGAEIFRQGPFVDATNNVGEFLALVHALAFLQQRGLNNTIYSDSRTAIAWVRNKHCKTTLKPTPANEKLFQIIARAETWINTHTWINRIIKWDTEHWGEIPADFGRK